MCKLGLLMVMVCSWIYSIPCRSQNYAVYNTYPANLPLYNPAESATEFAWLHANYRQQWMTFDGAPSLSTVNFSTLINESRAGIGFKASSYSRGLLRTSDFSFSYAYIVPTSPKSNVYLGLSGGIISNNIDVSDLDSSDPAISQYLANNVQPAASFGMVYKSESGLNFGFALPQLFSPRFNSTSAFENTSIGAFDRAVVSAYYRRKVEGKLVNKRRHGARTKVKTKETYAPLEFYLLYKYEKTGNSQAEGTIKLNLSQNVWLGGTYKQSYGFAGLVGFSFERISLTYSYEPGMQPESGFSTGTHEVQLGLRLSELKKIRKPAPVLQSTLKTSNPGEHHAARFQQATEDPQLTAEQKANKKTYYVVTKAFADFNAADSYKQKLIGQKFNANVFYYEKERKYYVYVYQSEKQSDAHEEARKLKLYTKLKDGRVLTVTESNK